MLYGLKWTARAAIWTLGLAVVGGCAAFHQGTPSRLEVVSSTADEDFQLESKEQIRDFYESGAPRSALSVLQRWTDIQGMNEVTFRTNILLNIAAGEFSEDLYDRSIIDNIFKRINQTERQRYGYYFWWHEPVDRSFESFTTRVARELTSQTPDGSIGQLLCECYGGDCDSLFLKLRKPAYAGTKLRYYRDEEITQILSNRLDGHFAMYSGLWIPRGNNEILGNHPVMGMIAGGKKHGYSYDLVGELRVLDANERYGVDRDGQMDTTRDFLGYYVGVEFGRDLIRTPRYEFGVRLGAGWDGFSYDNPEDTKARENINSINFNVGTEYKYYLQKYSLRYIGIGAAYNIISYDRGGGENLAGNAISLRVSVGWSGNEYDNSRLRTLRYDY